MDSYLEKLSSIIVNYSIAVKEKERVLITIQNIECKPICKYLVKEIVKRKGIPFIKIDDYEISSMLLENTDNERIKCIQKQENNIINNYDSFIQIRYNKNDFEKKNIKNEIIKSISAATKETDYIRINKRKWVLLNYPSVLDAYKAKMKTEEFNKFAFQVMTIDYQDMEERMKPLKALMEKTKMVHVVGPNTDLTFSIEGMNIIPCCGKQNLPDGEIFTAPVKTSVNGVITYNVDSSYRGNVFHNVCLTFKDGKIIKATSAEDNIKLNEIFDTDEGARYIGEFSLGLNPQIKEAIGDILFDEKMIGSLHFTPGASYEQAFNGNKSSVHWDLVMDQKNGGELYFDDVLIRKDGFFILPELEHLNYI